MPATARRTVIRSALAVSVLVAMSALLAVPASAAIYYVGTGASCGDSANDRPNLGAALLSAALNAGPDEIRLTRTLTFTNQALDLVDWHATAAGALTLAGGYDDCDDGSASGRTALVGRLGDSLVVVRTSAQPSSVVTLRALELSGSEFRGVAVGSGGRLTLQDVWVHDNGGGALVTAEGRLTVDAASSLTDHDDHYPNGGGVSCSGAGAYFALYGKLQRNQATQGGGNLHVGPGCLAELFGGALIEGRGEFPGGEESASFGGGVYVDNGVLTANGGASRVVIRLHDVSVVGKGGGLFVSGLDAVVQLTNTLIRDNSARLAGAAMHVEGGASLTMDRAEQCPFLISCSQIDGNRLVGGIEGEAVSVDSSATARLRRTVVNQNGWGAPILATQLPRLFHVGRGGTLVLDGVGMGNNFAVHLLHAETGGTVVGQYVTAARNWYQIGELVYDPWSAVSDNGRVYLYSSIFDDTKGVQTLSGGILTADCLLVDSFNGLPPGSFFVGVPQFINAASNDLRQLPTSPGVDFCDETFVPWPGGIDIERQPRGVDLAGNPDGFPGIAGGLFDAGFDEVIGGILPFADGFEAGSAGGWSVKFP